jgi:zinc finger CCHC domain-containing protein 9
MGMLSIKSANFGRLGFIDFIFLPSQVFFKMTRYTKMKKGYTESSGFISHKQKSKSEIQNNENRPRPYDREEPKSKKECFHCRKFGHTMANCREMQQSNRTVMCYICGNSDHTSKNCREESKEFKFAQCFICKEQGHLSSKCPQNTKGVYPKGGSCLYCKGIDHLAKQCEQNPRNIKAAKAKEMEEEVRRKEEEYLNSLVEDQACRTADVDDTLLKMQIESGIKKEKPTVPKKKVVVF